MIATNDNSTQTDEPNRPTLVTNDDLKIKWISDTSSSNLLTESDEEPTKNVTEASIDKIQKANKTEHKIAFKECLAILYKYMVEYVDNMKETLTLMILFLSYQTVGPIGIWFIFLIFFTSRTINYTKLNKTTTKTENQVPNSEKLKTKQKEKSKSFPSTPKEIYKTLDLPEANKLKLKKKVHQLKQARKPKSLREDLSSDEELSEEAVYLSPHPQSDNAPLKYKLKGTVENIDTIFEFDTGSPISLICTRIWDEIENKDKLQSMEYSNDYADFNGNPVQIIGKYDLNYKIGNNTYFHTPTYVVQHNDLTKKHALIGADTMRAKRLGIGHEDGTGQAYLTFKANNHQQKIAFDKPKKCYVTNKIEVDTGQTALLTLSVTENINRITILNSSEVTNTHGISKIPEQETTCLIPRESLISLDNRGCFQVPVTNKAFGTLTFTAGQQLGEFEPLEEDTILQTTHNTIEKLDHTHKPSPDISNAVLQL